ncbi:MAG: F0F1 ATP synthase subunit B [Bacteroidota bacterium]
MNQLLNDFSPGLFVMQTVLLLGLIFLLVKFAWKPILNSLDDREKGIQDALDAAESAKKEMQNITADSESLLKEARAERESLLKEARELKEKILADAKEEAQKEGDKMIAKAQATIESEKKAAVADIKAQVATLSIDIAEKVIRDELSNKSKQQKLVDDMLGDIKLN